MDVPTQILEAATRLLAERGFEGTSLKAIADEVGIKKASLLYHFSSKDALRQAVLDRVLSHWNEALPRLMLVAAGRGIERFEAIFEELVDFFWSDPNRARLLLREILDRPEAMRAYLSGYVQPWVALVATHIRQGQRGHEVRRDCDPDAYVLQVTSMALAGLSMAHTMGSLLGTDDAAGQGDGPVRFVRELVRIARTSLFNDDQSTDTREGVSEGGEGAVAPGARDA